ncbi:ATP-dependent DNA helicase [bacterium]|nr:ATP-dependent DNA helicase [bacterium]
MSIKYDFENDIVYLSVRDLVQGGYVSFSDINIPIKSRGKLGRDLHKTYYEGKKNVKTEVYVSKEERVDDVKVVVSGRVDVIIEEEDKVILEEIKTVTLQDENFNKLSISDLNSFANQAKIYALLYSDTTGLPIEPRLVLFNLVTGEIREFQLESGLQTLRELFENRVKNVVDNYLELKVKNHERSIAGKLLKFPFPEKRETQKIMEQRIGSVLEAGKNLVISALAGCGKTAGTLFPVIKYALQNNKRVFFLTSKNTQQELVRETVSGLKGIKTLFMRASDQMCINNVKYCSPDFCPYLENLMNSGGELLTEILESDILTPDNIFRVSKEAMVCPFEMSLAIAEAADLIVGDYNYVFDPSSFIRRLFLKNDYSNFILIIDEVHNLLQRSRDYYSVKFPVERVKEAKKYAELMQFHGLGEMKKTLNKMIKLFNDYYIQGKQEHPEMQKYDCAIDKEVMMEHYLRFEDIYTRYLLQSDESLLEEVLNPLRDLYYCYTNFLSVLEWVDEGFATMFSADGGGTFEILCSDARNRLRERVNGFHSVIGMSATLTPVDYYMEVLGFEEKDTEKLQIPSPFPAENRMVMIVPSVSTTYKNRMGDYTRVGKLIIDIINVNKGNYLVFFPSFEYMEHVRFFIREESFKILVQRRVMNSAERAAFLEELRTSEQPVLLMGVQGGVFAEGVDYIGDTAIGVIVVGPQIPPPTYEQEFLCRYYQELNGHGFEYAYLYPGMNRTIQAAGRVIRSNTDRGVIVLLGKRFTQEQYFSLFPGEWENIEVLDDDKIVPGLWNFWYGEKP